ncbi:MAG: DUF2459 domain-containing protein [Alphaproteobacteria bacterium]|nr:DUF2459 domain-containing protein [Alphaproteobacteria bacterium]
MIAVFLGLTGQITPARADEVLFLVTSNGWHSGVDVARGDLSERDIPELADFPDAQWIEFGWGDADYYPAPKPTFAMAVGAALVPGPAVLHVAGLPAAPDIVFPTQERLAFRVSPEQFRNLIAYITATFRRENASRAPAAPGLYSFSHFYPANGTFDMFHTCNTWTANAVAAAGVPLNDPSQPLSTKGGSARGLQLPRP